MLNNILFVGVGVFLNCLVERKTLRDSIKEYWQIAKSGWKKGGEEPQEKKGEG